MLIKALVQLSLEHKYIKLIDYLRFYEMAQQLVMILCQNIKILFTKQVDKYPVLPVYKQRRLSETNALSAALAPFC